MGWVGNGQLDPELEAAIFATPIGKTSDPVKIDGDGMYLFQVNDEQTRAPDATQKAALETSAFSSWYQAQKANVQDHSRPTRSPPRKPRADGRPMLDALIAEARLRWGLDPAAGIAIVVSERLAATPIEPTIPLLVLSAGRLNLGLHRSPPPSPFRAATAHGLDPIGTLRRLYPPDHPVGRFGLPDGMTVGDLTADEQKDQLYLPPVAPVADLASPWGMPWLSARLREPDGCPWDREQTHASLRNHLLEEAYEVYDALEAGATPELAGELGDLLLQVVLHAQLAAEAGVFDMTDVWAAIASKIVRRHPHVFGDAEARTASDVNRQWERIKAGERAAAAATAPTARSVQERPRRHQPLAARAGREPGDAGAGLEPRATTGRRSTACWTRSARRSASSSRPRATRTGPRSWATCCSCS